MPTHFSSLGFPVAVDDAYMEQLLETALSGEQLRATGPILLKESMTRGNIHSSSTSLTRRDSPA
jgi:hypothetical protein